MIDSKTIANLKPTPKGAPMQFLADAAMPGLGIIWGSSDPPRPSWTFAYRVGGHQHRVKLGFAWGGPAGKEPTPEWLSPAAARAKAYTMREVAKAGVIAPPEKAPRSLPSSPPVTLAAGLDAYLATANVQRLRSSVPMEQMLRRELSPALLAKQIVNVSRADIRAVLANKGETHMANRLHSALGTMWRWFIDQELASVSPIPSSRPLKTEESRQRVLTDDELATVWRATEDRPAPLRAIVRTLILTGQRREEVAEMRWSELDLAAATWTIGAERYKTKTDHVVPLVPAVLALIDGQHRIAGSDWVFTSNGRNAMRLSNEGTILKRLTPAVADWRLHDLRRTFRTGLARLKVSRETADLIDHPRSGITGVYDRHLYIDEKRDALAKWSAHVVSILT